MSKKIWIGAIYLKDEGGYEIILKSLRHYKNRLKTIDNSPELKNAATMFASVLNQQAMKTIPKIDEMIQKIQDSLGNVQSYDKLKEDVPFLEKALSCYEADIHKAEDTGHEYFVKLVGDMLEARNDLETIKTALDKIKRYSK
jgi:septation ring formation regulator EzrA